MAEKEASSGSLLSIEGLESRIFLVRGLRVMLSHDLAGLYGVPTKALLQAMRRNVERFPEDFAFQLSADEFEGLRSQIVTSSRGGTRYRPFAFTEQGVAMLSSVLRSDQAIAVNIQIMRTFVKLRAMLESNKDLGKKLANLEQKYDARFRVVFDAIRELMNPPTPSKKKRIGFIQD